MTIRFLFPLALTLVLGGAAARFDGVAAPDLPVRLTDQEFWQLTEDLSEPNGDYPFENLVSNEMVLWRLVPLLAAGTKPGGVYMGVGPEQNFSYMAAVRPRMAFITDLRRGNLLELLMYKALFELSADRAEFVSRLFTKARPGGLTATSTVTELMDAYWDVTTSDQSTYAANLAAIRQQLTKTHTLSLSKEDQDGIASIYRAFYWYGPAITYGASTSLSMPSASGGSVVAPATYRHLMTQTDASGHALSFLASEEAFAIVKDLYARNLVIPVVGNFSGPKAIRAIGAYVRTHGATVTTFYVSNVEPYLRDAGSLRTFCANVATLPMDDSSVLVRTGNAGSLPQDDPSVFSRPVGQPLVGPTRQIGTFVTGIVVPMATGCGR